MHKPVVFISHITTETQLANLIKSQIEEDFLGMIEVFVSSDGESITAGNKWLNTIDLALKNAHIMLILCSHDSIGKPWINFESGAGWVKGIPVIPICHTGLRLVDLPIPINMLQGVLASDSNGLKQVYSLLANQLGSATPNQQFNQLISSIKIFESEYGVLRMLRLNIYALIKGIPELKEIFKPRPVHKIASGMVDTILIDKIRPHLDALQNDGWVSYAIGHNGNVILDNTGHKIDLKIEVSSKYDVISEQVKIEYP